MGKLPTIDRTQAGHLIFCMDCPLTDELCEKRNVAEEVGAKGPVCWYQVYDPNQRMDTPDMVYEALRQVVVGNYWATRHLQRMVAAQGPDVKLLREMRQLSDVTHTQMIAYLKARGWYKKAGDDKDEEAEALRNFVLEGEDAVG